MREPLACLGVCPLVANTSKACAVRPGFASVVGELGATDPRMCSNGAIKAHASSWMKLGRWGTSSTRDQKGRTVSTCFIKGPKKRTNFFSVHFFGPHPKDPNLDPRKKVYVPHFLGKDPKKELFRGDFWGQKRGSKRAIFDHEKFSLLLFFFLLNQPRRFSLSVGVRLSSAGWAGRTCRLRNSTLRFSNPESRTPPL